jgi:hypothetical protein
MANKRGKSEGVRVLAEIVCQAIPDPSLQGPGDEVGAYGRGRNQGIRVLEEVDLAAGSSETREAARRGRESLPHLLICAIFYFRALELERRLPVSLGELDFGEQGSEATVRVVARYLMARELDLARPSEVRSTFLLDLAVLMADLARPRSIFLAGAPKTAVDVARCMLQFEGWTPATTSFSEWQARTVAINPSSPSTAKEYLALLRRAWGWVGNSTETNLDHEEFAKAVAIPDAVLTGLASRCI